MVSQRVSAASARCPAHALSLAGFNDDAAENILENRRRFLKLFPGHWALAGCWQVHGADVRVVKTVEEAKPAENQLGDTIYCDVIVSGARGVLAGVKTADCVPLLIGDPVTGAFAAVHAGWRGTLAGCGRRSGAVEKESTTRSRKTYVSRLAHPLVHVVMKSAAK